eukprot:TRINITY_DN7935_c0_g3_i1.p3 TRINITY_DN7935_c0_g3~~TRINITY_DN7935_c0_g3_i1.p3  ORF type:complete len:120 (-),score=30.99 TRINITY_DN7935_c0_g3_i1:277-636(-)
MSKPFPINCQFHGSSHKIDDVSSMAHLLSNVQSAGLHIRNEKKKKKKKKKYFSLVSTQSTFFFFFFFFFVPNMQSSTLDIGQQMGHRRNIINFVRGAMKLAIDRKGFRHSTSPFDKWSH